MYSNIGPGGGALRYRGGPHLSYVFRGRRGVFWRPPHVRDFVKEGYFFVPRYEVWGSKCPYNPRNIRGSDAEWLPKYLVFRVCCRHLLLLNTQRIIKYKVKIRVPFNQCQCFDKRRGVFLVEKVSVFIKIRVLFWPEISALGVFLNFDNERMRPPKYAPPPGILDAFIFYNCFIFFKGLLFTQLWCL